MEIKLTKKQKKELAEGLEQLSDLLAQKLEQLEGDEGGSGDEDHGGCGKCDGCKAREGSGFSNEEFENYIDGYNFNAISQKGREDSVVNRIFKDMNKKRILLLIKQLEELGMEDSIEEVHAFYKGLHFAVNLMEKNDVEMNNDFFFDYLQMVAGLEKLAQKIEDED